MPTTLNENGKELLSKIQIAGSQEEVKILLDDSLKKLKQNKEGIKKVALFVDKIIIQLETLNPMNKDANQWSNINMARIHLQHIKRAFELTAGK